MSSEMKKLMAIMESDSGAPTGQYPYLEALKAAAQGNQKWADKEPRWMVCWYAALSFFDSDTRDIARDIYDGDLPRLTDDAAAEAWIASMDDEELEDDEDGDGGLAAFARGIIQAIS